MANREKTLQGIDEKYQAMRQDPDVHLQGLLVSEPITYWDYIHVDALLGLQIQRTQMPDEMVFIMYHQVNEILFKMILWEIAQVSKSKDLQPERFAMHLDRVSRYFDLLANSFEIMGKGMEKEQYNQFRHALYPASGFQSAQYRKIEFASTELINLIDIRFRATIDRNTPFEHAFEHLYWQAAGKNYQTGEKTPLLSNFERKYKPEFMFFMEDYNESNLLKKFKELPAESQSDKQLINAMRHYDHTVNVRWVMAHLNAAQQYIGGGEATGGSDWQKYMHPKYQRRVFFPELWSETELTEWGITNLEGYERIS
jgi:tryptophan 2,3-dioxygenase